MRVLVACEFSGVVRDAFIAVGHEAYSCDLSPSETPGPHFQCDVLQVLDHGWDLMIAHPPCTYLARSGARWWADRVLEQSEALDFVRSLWYAEIPRIAIENPVGVLNDYIGRPAQTIQPYNFGHDASKGTCLWLKNLPKLWPTEIVPPRLVHNNGKLVRRWANQTDSGQNAAVPHPDRAKDRSRTYAGIAAAMAAQWG